MDYASPWVTAPASHCLLFPKPFSGLKAFGGTGGLYVCSLHCLQQIPPHRIPEAAGGVSLVGPWASPKHSWAWCVSAVTEEKQKWSVTACTAPDPKKQLLEQVQETRLWRPLRNSGVRRGKSWQILIIQFPWNRGAEHPAQISMMRGRPVQSQILTNPTKSKSWHLNLKKTQNLKALINTGQQFLNFSVAYAIFYWEPLALQTLWTVWACICKSLR